MCLINIRLITKVTKMNQTKYPFCVNSILTIKDIFYMLCNDGCKEDALWLYNVSKINKKWSIELDQAFRDACTKNHKNVAECLYELSKTDEHIRSNFSSSYENGFLFGM